MTAPTVPVTIHLSDGNGVDYAGVAVIARLDRSDSYGGDIIPRRVGGTTDSSGLLVLNLFPNDPIAGLGTTGSRWMLKARPSGARPWQVAVQVPNSSCNLSDLADLSLIPSAVPLAATVRSTVLTGLSVASAADVTSADTILSAAGKLQAKHTALSAPGGAARVGYPNIDTPISVEQALDILYYGVANVTNPRFAGGAKVDGASDDKAAIQAALSSGAKFVSCHIAGTALVSGGLTVPAGVRLMCEGQTTIKAKNAAFGAGGSVITLGSGASIVGFTVDANRQNNVGNITGIAAPNASGVLVRRNTVLNSTYGINFANGTNNEISGNIVDGCLFYGILVKLATTADTASGYLISGNKCRNIASDGTANADGQGIVVYGATGPLLANYKNVTKVVITGNECSACAAHGIDLIAVSDFTVTGNNCHDCTQNTTFASGICISEACTNGTVSGNTCTGNYDCGILLDVVDQAGNRFTYGHLAVTGNSCDMNGRAGIRNNSMPHTTITGNSLSRSVWGYFQAHGGFNVVSSNTISYCSENGIRLAGVAGPTGDDQTHVTVANNMIEHCTGSSGKNYGAIYASYYTGLKIANNDFSGNTQDIGIDSTCRGVTLIENGFTSHIYIDSSVSIQRWNDEFRTTAAGKSFNAVDFGGDGMSSIRVNAGFSLPHFGLQWCPVLAVAPVTSSLTQAIAVGGFVGQRLQIINYNTSAITIKHNAGTKNIGAADVVLAFGEMAEYLWRSTEWVQTAAKVATSI